MIRKRKNKRGFTVVELVIVIAVIAILAAVLIPTFAGIIKKSNLSADKQAVREMNMALAADEALNGKPQDISLVMQILADAGYNSDNWQCLTKGYEVYWYKADNRLVLYNASEALVEYPKEYDADLMTSHNKEGFYLYNENHIKAQQFPTTLGAPPASGKTLDNFLSSGGVELSSDLTSHLQTALNSAELKNVLPGGGNDVYIYNARQVTEGNAAAHASLIMASAGTTVDPVLRSNSDDELKTNLYYLSVVQSDTATEEQIREAQIEAGNYIYNVFDQITTGRLDPEVSIVFAPDTKIVNAPDKEWAPPKIFTGYFGTTDPEHPVIVDGVKLSKSTGYSQTVSFDGSKGKYYMTGVFGTVYGKTTIENVIFQNMTIKEAGSDFWLNNHDYKINDQVATSRSTFGIIGGITNKNGNEAERADVTLRNIEVKNTVTIDCDAGGGGLVGYIGSAAAGTPLLGDVTFENCHVSANLTSDYQYVEPSPGGYGPVGGIVGFTCRTVKKPYKLDEHGERFADGKKWDTVYDAVSLTFKDCQFDGRIRSTYAVGACIGDINNPLKSLKFEGTNHFENADISTTSPWDQLGYVIGSTAQISMRTDNKNINPHEHRSVLQKWYTGEGDPPEESATQLPSEGRYIVSGADSVVIPAGAAAFCSNKKKPDGKCYRYNMDGTPIDLLDGELDKTQETKPAASS